MVIRQPLPQCRWQQQMLVWIIGTVALAHHRLHAAELHLLYPQTTRLPCFSDRLLGHIFRDSLDLYIGYKKTAPEAKFVQSKTAPRTVVKMVDFGYKPPSSIPKDAVSPRRRPNSARRLRPGISPGNAELVPAQAASPRATA